MGPYSIWPAIIIVLLIFYVARTKPFAQTAAPAEARSVRFAQLDGLRGYLALGVFFHHVARYPDFIAQGAWQPPPSRFYDSIGPISVAIFFMITGFLFWNDLLNRKGHQNWTLFYIHRLFRIAPVYFVAMATVLLIVAVQTDFQLRVGLDTLASEIGRMLSLGLFMNRINDFDAGQVLSYTPWTLQYEWFFYVLLPLGAWAAQRDWSHLPFAAGGLALALICRFAVDAVPIGLVALFFAGMTVASLKHAGFGITGISEAVRSTVVVGMVVVTGLASSAYNVTGIIAISIAFFLIMSGSSVFGLLTAIAARWLGTMSYSIYLLHGIMLYLVFASPFIRALAIASPMVFWIMVCVATTTTMAIALIVHVTIERPGVRLGRHWGPLLAASIVQDRRRNAPTLRPLTN